MKVSTDGGKNWDEAQVPSITSDRVRELQTVNLV